MALLTFFGSSLKQNEMVTCTKGKAVIVTRYVLIRPRRVSSDHHVHQTVKRESVHYGQNLDGKRFVNRRIELLQYSQRLRESAGPIAPKTPTPLSNSLKNQTRSQSLDARKKPRTTRTCLGNCGMTFPRFPKLLKLRSRKEANKKKRSKIWNIKSVTKILQVPKQRGFFSKLLLKSRKDR